MKFKPIYVLIVAILFCQASAANCNDGFLRRFFSRWRRQSVVRPVCEAKPKGPANNELFIKAPFDFDDSETQSALIQRKLRPTDDPKEWKRFKLIEIKE